MRATLVLFLVLPISTLAFVGEEPGPVPSSPASAERFDDWTVIGPGGGGAQFHPNISPVDPELVLSATDMSEGYISRDGGESWRMFNVRGHVRWFAFDPNDRDVMYVRTRGLFRTGDGGRTWRLVHPAPEDVVGIAIVDDHAIEWYVTKEGPPQFVNTLAVDPADSDRLYAVMRTGGRMHLATSGDRGATWSERETFPAELDYSGMLAPHYWKIFVAPRSPEEDRTLYVLGDHTVSVRRGGEWTHREGPGLFLDADLGFTDGSDPVIYATTEAAWEEGELTGGPWVSPDGAKTWRHSASAFERACLPGGTPLFRAVGTCLADGEVAYLSYLGLVDPENPQETFFGTAKTTDGARSWELAIRETATKRSPRVDAGWITERFGPEWGHAPLSIAVDPNDPDFLLTTDDGRILRSRDGLETLEAVYTKETLETAPGHEKGRAWTTTGIDVTTCYGVHWDPFDPQTMFISYTDIGLMKSTDGGTTWKSATANGVPADWVNTTYWMVFDPEVEGRAWAVMSRFHDLPRPKMFRTFEVSDYLGGVVKTEDCAQTWRVSNEGMPETAPTDIILDPESPAGSRTLYVAGFGTGVWKSTDDGRTWQLKNKGIEGDEPFAWRIVMGPEGTLYLVVARRSEDGSYGTPGDGALYESTDGAESWRRLDLPEGVNGPHGIAVDPREPDRLYLACWGREKETGDVGGGIFLSRDGAESWEKIFDRQQHVYDVHVDPRNPDVLYAGTMSFSVWRSPDRGETWKRVRGYNFKQANRVVPDPFHADKIYVTTFGGSVWYGPAEGDPDAAEDVVTPAVGYDTYRKATPEEVRNFLGR